MPICILILMFGKYVRKEDRVSASYGVLFFLIGKKVG